MHEFAADTENKLAAEHIVAKVFREVLPDFGPLLADVLRPALDQVGNHVAVVAMADRISPSRMLSIGIRPSSAWSDGSRTDEWRSDRRQGCHTQAGSR